MQKNRAFTLLELMIVVAVIAILAAVAIPKFADMLRRSRDAATLGNLSILRSALNTYSANNSGWNPTDDLTSIIQQSYIDKMPTSHVSPYHKPSQVINNNTTQGTAAIFLLEDGQWNYWNFQGQPAQNRDWGSVWIGCSHTDSKHNFVSNW